MHAEEQPRENEPATSPVSAPPAAEPFALKPGALALWEWLVVSTLCAVCLVYWLLHYHQFFVPPVDTQEFLDLSREMWSLKAPTYYKRMPLFPFVIGLVGKLIPAREPELEAALSLNILFSGASLVFLYLVARKMIGWAAIVPLCFLAASNLTHNMAGQPLVEPIMGLTLLLSLWLFQRKSRWQYLALFFAALTRYENSALIAIFFILNWIDGKKFWKPLLLSAAASSGFLFWMLLSALHHGSGTNPYVSQMARQGWVANPDFAWRFVEVSFAEWGAPVLAVAALAGLALSWQQCRRESLAIFSYAVLYVGAHVAFGANRSRYAYPILWVLPLYVATCLSAALGLARSRLCDRWRGWMSWSLAGVAALAAAGSLLYAFRKLDAERGLRHAAVYVTLAGAIPLVAASYAAALLRRPAWAAAALALGLVALAAPAAGRGVDRHAKDSWAHYYRRYGSYRAGRWLEENLTPGQNALAPHASLVAICGKLKPERVLAFSQLESRTMEDLPAELRRKGVAYVVFTRYKLPAKGDPRHARLVRRYRPEFLDHFEKGEPVPGFEHVLTIEIPKRARRKNAQIYRVLPAGEVPGGNTSRGPSG
jgi:hypothetical protein